VDIQRVFTLARRVFSQIVRDRRTLALVFIAPIFVLALGGILFKSGPENLALGVVNEDEGVEAPAPVGHVSLAELIVAELKSDQTFNVTELAREEVDAALRAGQVKGAVIFAPNFSRAVREGGQTTVGLRLEGSNPSTAAGFRNHLSRLMMQRLVSLAKLTGQEVGAMPVIIEPSFLYGGPQFDSLDYIAPVYIAFLVFFFVFILTCVFFLRERSQGTMERLLATPINRLEIVLGYMLGLGALASIQSVVILLFTVYVLDIDYVGNLLVVFIVEIILTIVAANVGILASTFATNEFQVVQFIPLVIISQILLSGAIWAIEEMPSWLQPVAWVVPMTYANRAMRAVMIKGHGLASIWGELVVLAGFATLVITLSALTVRREVT
jgi:ABC-2 type transport system permease protein